MKKKQIIELLIIFILGLTPLLWFNGNQIILGHDSGLTLFPISHFFDRLSAWTERFAFGSDQTYAMAGFFIHGLDALVASFGFSLQEVQKIVFIFWFVLPGLTMYYFSSRLAKKLQLPYFALPVSIFYMFNHFLLQGWFVAERTKFSVYAALPLAIAFLFDWEEKKRSTIKTAAFISLTFFVLNGEASLPLFGGVFLTVIAFSIFYLYKKFSIKKIWQLGKLFGLIIIISIFLNAYWLFPYGMFLLHSYASVVSQAGGLNGVLGWLNYVSQDSSLMNLFRLQGIPEWYLNPNHPYASIYLHNIFFVSFSFLLPLAAFLPLYFTKSIGKDLRKTILFFSFLTLFSMTFIAGAHPPLGALYILFIKFLPGFIAFRNPFYKFAPALWFSYAILIGITLNYVLLKLQKRVKIVSYLLYGLVCLLLVVYSFPFLNGMFFDYIKGERSTRIIVPQYIYDFGRWSESKERLQTKVLALPPVNPDNKIDTYTWGYWSLSPLTSLLTNAPIITKSGYMTDTEKGLVGELYEMMKYNRPGWQNFARVLGIHSFLLRNDFNYTDKSSPTDNPALYKKALTSPDVVFKKKFGEWEVYDLKTPEEKPIASYSKINFLIGDSQKLAKISSLPFFDPKEPIDTNLTEVPTELSSIQDKIFLVPTCVLCNLQHKVVDTTPYTPQLESNSIFYPLIQLRDSLKEKKLMTREEKIKFYLYQSLVDILAFNKLATLQGDQGEMASRLNEYKDSFKEYDTNLNAYILSNKIVDQSLFSEISDILRVEKTFMINNVGNVKLQEAVDLLEENFDNLDDSIKKVDKNLIQTTDETNKKFYFSSNIGQQFSFYYRPNFSHPLKLEKINYTLDNNTYTVPATSISSQWFILGKLNISKGEHILSIEQPLENLYQGRSLFQLKSSSESYCFSSNKVKGYKGDVFKITFQHRRISGSRNFSVKVMKNDEKVNKLHMGGDDLRSSSSWDNYTAYWPSQDRALAKDQTFYLTICNAPTVDKEDFASTIEIKNINIRKITTPDIVLYHAASTSARTSSTDFIRKSQTEYLLPKKSISGSSIVVLNESFNNNWIVDGATESTKFFANGYANGWIVNGNIKDVIVKYTLQDFVTIGFGISAFSAVLVLLYLVKTRKKNE